MTCQELLRLLETAEPTEWPASARDHLLTCPACRRAAEVQQGVETCLTALGRATPTVDLSAGIMQAVRTITPEPPETGSAEGLSRCARSGWPWARLLPALVIGATVALGLLWASRPGPDRGSPPGPVRPSEWEAVHLDGVQNSPSAQDSLMATGSRLPLGGIVRLAPGGRVRLQRAGQTRAEVRDGSFLPLPSGLFLFAGVSNIRVGSDSPPLSFGTPFGEIQAPPGSQFTLLIEEDGLRVGVQTGRVKVAGPSRDMDLGPGGQIFLGDQGFVGDTASSTVTIFRNDELTGE